MIGDILIFLKSKFYSRRLSNNKSTFLFIIFLILIVKSFIKSKPSFPRWRRMGRVIDRIDKYSKNLTREFIENDERFRKFTDILVEREEPPYLLYLDDGYLDITLNHICNLEYMSGTISRLAMVSFDEQMGIEFHRIHPNIPIATLDFSSVKNSIPEHIPNRRYIIYQLALMLRSHIAAVLSSRGISFWSMQQDSIWTENFVSMEVEKHYPNSLLIFDTVGNDQVALIMTRRQSPDSSIMTYLCGAPHYKCSKMPRWLVSSSNFFMGDRSVIPIIIQVDHSSNLTKMELFKRENLVFMKNDGTCNASAVIHVKESVAVALEDVRNNPPRNRKMSTFNYILWYFHRHLGFDPYYNKRFLRVHESLV